MPPCPLAFEHSPSGFDQELNPELTRHITPGSLDRISPTSRQRANVLGISVRTFPIDLTDSLADGGRKVRLSRRLSRERDERAIV
jgi:hypothetical protein